MQEFGICHLSVVPLREEAADRSEMVSQMLYGELLTVLDRSGKWSRVKLEEDGYEGWISSNQYRPISDEDFFQCQTKIRRYNLDLVEYVWDSNKSLIPITLGASIHNANLLDHSFDGHLSGPEFRKDNLLLTAQTYLNSPYLWGGKTPFGIDCSGFVQMVYRLNNIALPRDASDQSLEGEVLSFIEETEPGDLAFFDNSEGKIIHVGMVMPNNYIIHAHGQVRIDRLDQSGIYNVDTNQHSHQLRLLKKMA